MQPQVILITGASSGFGKITAQMLSERGHIVYGTSRKPSEGMNHVKMLVDRKSTRLNSSHPNPSRMPSSA